MSEPSRQWQGALARACALTYPHLRKWEPR